MPSELFDPLLELAFSVAQKGSKKKPRQNPPQRLVPMLRFTRMPARARQTIYEVLDSEPDFRSRVLAAADERTVGRAGMAFLERTDGWEELVDRFVAAVDEPIIEPSADTRKLEHRLSVAERTVVRLEAERDAALADAASLRDDRDALRLATEGSTSELEALRSEIEVLADERRRAVAELKQTELLMARHVAQRKLAERQLADMAAAQMNTVTEGGAISDREVRERSDRLRGMLTALGREVAELKEQATPNRTTVERRTPMPLPPGVHDDSEEAMDYLLRIPEVVVLVDGYNVSKSAHDDWDLEAQRDWLEQCLRALAARTAASFDVVFDGADLPGGSAGARDRGVSVRFSPDGVEADDVLIEAVHRVDRVRPVVVVSSDKRVVDGARRNGANTASSEQLLALLD